MLVTTLACSEGPPVGPSGFDGGSVIFWRPDAFTTGGPPDLIPALPDSGSGEAPDMGGTDLDGADGETDPCEAAAEAVLTATAAAEASELFGAIVEVSGVATDADVICTSEPCPPDNPCCNTCSGRVVLDGELLLSDSECLTLAPGCRGTTCTLVCSPPLLGLPERYRGRLTETIDGPELEVFEVLTPNTL